MMSATAQGSTFFPVPIGPWAWPEWIHMDSSQEGLGSKMLQAPSSYHGWHHHCSFSHLQCSSRLQFSTQAVLQNQQLPHFLLLSPRVCVLPDSLQWWFVMSANAGWQSFHRREIHTGHTNWMRQSIHKYALGWYSNGHSLSYGSCW